MAGISCGSINDDVEQGNVIKHEVALCLMILSGVCVMALRVLKWKRILWFINLQSQCDCKFIIKIDRKVQ